MGLGTKILALLFLIGLTFSSVHAKEVRLDTEGKPCEEMVDLSETGQFHRLHFACADKKAVKEAAPSVDVVKDAGVAKGVSAIKGMDYHEVQTRLELSAENGASLAIGRLFNEMAKTCPNGWRKLEETVVVADQGKSYNLHFSYTCISE